MNQDTFRSDFRHIVWLKGQVTECNNYIKRLSKFDRNESHQKAILKAINQRDEKNKELTEALQGFTYDQWLEISRKLSYITSKLIKAIERKEVLQSEINRLFDKY